MILKAIIREEASHTQFYWSVARLELRNSEFAKKMARWVLDNYYVPVGQGSKPKKQAEFAVSALFAADNALDIIDKTVTQRVRQLPGFDDFTTVSEKLGTICREAEPIFYAA